MELDSPLQAAQNTKVLLDFFRKNNLPIIHIRHESIQKGAGFLIPNTAGVEIHSAVKPHEGEFIVTKNYPNSFRNTNLSSILRDQGKSHLVICGMMTHMCVSSTTRAAWDLGYNVSLIHDACATRSLESVAGKVSGHNVHIAHISALERFAKIQNHLEFFE